MNKEKAAKLSASYEFIARALAPHYPTYRWYNAVLEALAFGLQADGWHFEVTPRVPYASSEEMFRSFAHYDKTCKVFAGGSFAWDNPLIDVSCVHDTNGNRMPYYMLGRVVHDILGHWPSRAPIETFEGELLAHATYLRHFPEELHGLLYTDDIAQLAYNFTRGQFVTEQRPIVLPALECIPLGELL